jgi:RNA polymerase sigma-70 factor (ECF subfamily)
MPDPLQSALAAERRAALRSAVAGLGEPYREVVALRYFGELSLEEVAAATGRNLNTIKTQLRRGLERLAGDASAGEIA